MEECYLKVALLHECFSHFLNSANSTKSRNASQIMRFVKVFMILIIFFY